VRRNFDRKQGAKGAHAPGEARKDGAVGEVDPSQFQGSVSEFVALDAAQVADANGDIVGDMILDLTPIAADPEDAKLTYDEYLAQKARVDEDVNRQTREVIVDEENFVKVKQFQKEEEATFFDSVKAAPKQRDEEAAQGKKGKKKNVISLDEFVGVSGPVASTESGEREGIRGGRGGGRGGAFVPRGGRGGFRGDSTGERREYTPREPRADGSAPTRSGRGGRGVRITYAQTGRGRLSDQRIMVSHESTRTEAELFLPLCLPRVHLCLPIIGIPRRRGKNHNHTLVYCFSFRVDLGLKRNHQA